MRHVSIFCAAVLLLGVQQALAAQQETIVPEAEARREVMVKDVQSHDGIVSGMVVNSSAVPIRDVKLLIDEAWFWKNERHPGISNPSRAEFYTLSGEIPPGGSRTFTYPRQPLPQRTDGRFEVNVKVEQFTELGAGPRM